MKLSELPIGATARIKKINLSGSIRQRLLDFGMVEHTPITHLQTACGGDPSAFFIRGTVIALRRTDSCNIELY